MIVHLSGSIDDNSADMRLLIEKLTQIYRESGDRKWQLRCRECRYLGPWATALIASAYHLGQNRNQEPRITLPMEPPALKAYCVFSGMEFLFQGGAQSDSDHSECETIPLIQFHQANWNLPDSIVRLLKRHTELDSEREDQLLTCVHEVTQNIEDHSESETGGVMSARYFASTQEVRVGIVDNGIGIGSALRKKFPEITDSFMALNKVIEGGYSSKSRLNNMGLGVSNLFSLIRNSGGRISVFTGNAMAELRPDSTPKVEVDLTHISLT